jgi:hypothetical protein
MAEATATLWRNREFNLLWVSQSLSEAGNAISTLAVPLLVLSMTGSAALAGLVGTTGLVVTALSRLPAGVLVDRVDRRRIMLLCDVVRLVAYAILGLAAWRGSPPVALIVAVVAVGAVGNAFFGTAEHSSLRNIVAIGQLPDAVARNEARTYATSLAGPPLGGLLFGLGSGLPFLGNALTFLASMAGVALVRRPLQERRDRDPAGHLSALAEGLRFVLSDPFLRTFLLLVAPFNLGLHGMIFTVIVTLQANGVPPGFIGIVETVVAAGGLLGSLAAPVLLRRMGLPVLVRTVLWSAALLMALCPLFAGGVGAAVPLGLAVVLGPATNAALFAHQAGITPDRLQGRVTSVIIVLATSVAAGAPLLAGVLITVAGPVAATLVLASTVAIAAMLATRTRHLVMMV